MTTKEKYSKATNEYLERLAWQNLAETTIENYRATLTAFGEHLNGLPDDVDIYEAVESWKEAMLSRGNAPSTVCIRLTELGCFFTKACKRSFPKEYRYGENPVEEVEFPKVVKTPYGEVLTDEQIMRLYENKPYKGARNWAKTYAIVMLLLNEKIRNSELRELKLSDVDMIHHELAIHGKGRKFRVVDLSAISETAIALYLESGLRPSNLSDDDYLFGNTRSGAWSKGTRQGLSDLVRFHVASVCGCDGARSHAMRHVGARICLNAGASMEELQAELGHSAMSTTAIYSGRLMQRRRRESAQAVLAARDAAAKQNAIALAGRGNAVASCMIGA